MFSGLRDYRKLQGLSRRELGPEPYKGLKNWNRVLVGLGFRVLVGLGFRV